MLKIAVYDSGFGGELFADFLKEELDVAEVVRVIDWRNADQILGNRRSARKAAETAIRPYIGRVDLIVFANHLLTSTSLKYFKHKYKTQKFSGFELTSPDTFIGHPTFILATKAVTRTFYYRNFVSKLKRKVATIILDDWPAKIDDGELSLEEIQEKIKLAVLKYGFSPDELILACSQFTDIKDELIKSFNHSIKIYDSFSDAYYQVCKILKLRGGAYRKQRK
ncbi:MAG: hypothetical protein Q4A79_01485 [Candidatus Saccharibacteria bacterium]|nr:hypothetical protein [Candidatus Saccharibacteria bacterium]